jgi:hypothetical protein
MYEKTSSILQHATPFTKELSVPNDFFTALQSHCDNDPESSLERETNANDGVGFIF